MRIRCSRFRDGNFGDDLNTWLWPRLLPGIAESDDQAVMLGIGSYLSPEVVDDRSDTPYIVLGTGAGYRGMRFTLWSGFPWNVTSVNPSCATAATSVMAKEAWRTRVHIYWVRGPLTARYLGLDESLAISDPALLVPLCAPGMASPVSAFGYMPHHRSAAMTDIASQCEQAGFRFVDPRAGIEKVIRDITSCKVLLTEALHGAIAADALRVPWIPVRSASYILPFKWLDYCAAMGLSYQPAQLSSPWDAQAIKGNRRHVVPPLLRPLVGMRTWLENRRNQKSAPELLLKASRQEPQLSSDAVMKTCVNRMQNALARFEKDWRSGKFSTRPDG